MRLSSLLGKTLRQPPSDAHLISHQLLVRAGYLRTVESGHFAYLPLGQRALERLHALARHQLARRGGQEIDLPTLPDSDPTATLVRLVGREVDSYRQLPLLLYQVRSRAVPEPASRAGLFGASERPFVEIHAFGPADMAEGYDLAITRQTRTAIDEVLASCGLPAMWAGVGAEGFRAYYSHPSGDEDLVRCPACSYAQERSWATTSWPHPPDETELPAEEIATPGCDTIASLAEFLQIPASQTLKMVFYSVEGKVNCAVIRGDRSVDETKLARVLGTYWYYTSLEDELEAVGAVGGYASPVGLDPSRVRVIADPSVRSGRNFVSGANRPDFHIQNVNIPRDFVPGEWADLFLVEPGDPCPKCGSPLEIETAFALAQSSLPKPCQPEAEYLDSGGRSRPLWTARWQLDLGRVMAAIIEEHHDDYGIVWPAPCAPLDAHLVGLDLQKEIVGAQAEALYDRLQAEGITVLLDDRNASAGVKFNDADLIGIPLRLTVSKRSAKEGLIEAKWRSAAERLKLDDDGLAAALSRLRRA
jgi:prolyl-tRNA synthetase